jgi:hypothetical protein
MIYIFTPNKLGYIPKEAKEAITRELLSRAGKKSVLSLSDYKKIRSNEQLGFWFGGIVDPFRHKYGYDKDFAHSLLKLWCGWYNVVIDPDGNEQRVIRSINKNEKGGKTTTTDMMGLIETAMRKCAEHDLYIKSPDEYFMKNPIAY